MQPPGVIQFNASNVPVVQMTLSSKTLTEQQIYDYSLNFIRIRLFTIPGPVHARPVRRQVSGRSSSISTRRGCRRKASRRSMW